MMRYEKGRMNRPRGFDLYDGRMIGSHGGDFYWKGDYKALEKQCDEGLARELSLNHDLLDAKEHIHLLTKRIAEAQNVIGRAFDTLEHVRRGANITPQDAWNACEILESFNRDACEILESFNRNNKDDF